MGGVLLNRGIQHWLHLYWIFPYNTVCSNREMIRIAGDDYPAEVVKSRFLKIDSSHIEYVLERMRENTTYVRNIKKYLLAALYNAPVTMDSYYTSLVSHDLYGSGDRR